MLRRDIVITKKKVKKKKSRFLLKIFGLFLIAILGLFFFSKEFLSKINYIDKNIEKIFTLSENYLLFSDGEKKFNLNLETNIYNEVEFNLEEKRVVFIFDEKNILFQDENMLENTIGDKLEVENLQSISIEDGYIIVKANEKYGVYNNRLKLIIPIEYSYISKGERLFLVEDKNGKYGYLNLEGEIQVPFQYDIGNLDKNGEIVVYQDGKVGVIDNNNKTKIDIKYDDLISLYPYTLTKSEGNFYLYSPDLSKKKLDISWVGFYNGETLFYEKDSKFGLMGKDGKKLTRNIYDELGQRNGDIIITKKGKKYSFVDQKGIDSINIYDYILPIGDNFYIAGNDENNNAVILNCYGNKILYEDNYSEYQEINKDFLIATNNENSKLLNKAGKFVDNIDGILARNEKWLVYINNLGVNYINLRGER